MSNSYHQYHETVCKNCKKYISQAQVHMIAKKANMILKQRLNLMCHLVHQPNGIFDWAI